MNKNPGNLFKKYFYAFSAIFVVVIFATFRILDSYESAKIQENIKTLLRNEFNIANSYALAKSISDLEKIHLFKCARLRESGSINREFYNTTTTTRCNLSLEFILNFFDSVTIDSMSGTIYELFYVKNLDPYRIAAELIFYLMSLLIIYFLPVYFTTTIEYERAKSKIFEAELQQNNQIVRLSQKIAHDIRSPMSTLNLISARIADPEIQALQLAVVEQINQIANNLLTEIKNNSHTLIQQEEESGIRFREKVEEGGNRFHKKTEPKLENFKNSTLVQLFKNIEKEYSFKKSVISQNLVFEINYVDLERSKMISKNLEALIHRSINNFVQNSVEATPTEGTISIKVSGKKDRIEVIVKDTGRGIPPEILIRLGKEQISFGKSEKEKELFNSGSGIALFNANEDLVREGAQLLIDSKVGIGTSISIVF
jgi:signal transduction histidine kinase